MALSADDRLLGEKTHYYCSSSEDEAEQSDENSVGEKGEETKVAAEATVPGIDPSTYSGTCVNTGPKGVLRDYRRFKQLESEQREESAAERERLARRLAITCRTQEEDDAERELEELLTEANDDFLQQYREQRMRELQDAMHQNNPLFGKVIQLNKDNFLDAVDKENSRVSVVVHLYEKSVSACQALSGCLQCLAANYPRVKFCELKSSEALSDKFSASGVPALLVYKGGELVDSHIRLADQLGEDFFANELESFLIERGLLPSTPEVPGTVRAGQANDDSDFELD